MMESDLVNISTSSLSTLGCKKMVNSATLVHLEWFAFFVKSFINIWLELVILLFVGAIRGWRHIS